MRGFLFLGLLAVAPTLMAQEAVKPLTPRGQFEALLEKYDAPRGVYINDHSKAKIASEGFLRLARECSDDPVAVDALGWVVTHTLFTPEAGQALTLLARDHRDSERLGPIIREIDSLYGDPFEPLEAFLRAVLAEGPLRENRGLACLALARYHMSMVQKTRRDAHQYELLLRGVKVPFVLKPKLAEADLERLKEEAANRLRQVIDEFGDVPLDKKRTLGAAAESDLDELRELPVGEIAPEIDGQDFNGKRFKLSDFRGKVVVLTFSGNWCPPCRAMYPHERELVQRLKDKPFALLSVNTDEKLETLRKSIKEGEITWLCWWDGGIEGPICSKWNVQGFPTVYVLDHHGVIRYKGVQGAALDATVDILLKRMTP